MATKRKTAVVQKTSHEAYAPQNQHHKHRGTKNATSNNHQDNVLNFNSYVSEQKQKRKVELIPKSIKQEEYIELLTDENKKVVFATGPAGTGKTMLAVLSAVKALKEGVIEKIIITRPAVEVDNEKFGFLPGTLNDKMEPWTKPIFDIMKEYYSPRDIIGLLEDEVIEISPLAFLRGRTFKSAWIIADEMQNSSVNQMKMLLTRLGDDAKLAITGDLKQNDRKYTKENGLQDFIALLQKRNSEMIGVVNFGNKDIMRSAIVKEVLEIYGDE